MAKKNKNSVNFSFDSGFYFEDEKREDGIVEPEITVFKDEIKPEEKEEKQFKENMNTDEMLEYLASKGIKKSKKWAEHCRWKKEGGPKFFKLDDNGRGYYRLLDIDDWIVKNQKKKG
ncbi:MAG: hypothetical protein HOF64_04385 [Nitrospina sp.]|nr:hypothetical protein [Nitrospina sp.]